MKTFDPAYAIAAVAALVAAALPFYLHGAVGIVDPPSSAPVAWLELGVLAVAVVGVLLARFRPSGMARAMVATAIAQAVAGVAMAIVVPPHPASPPAEVLGVNAIFVVAFLGAAWLFRRAARPRSATGAARGG